MAGTEFTSSTGTYALPGQSNTYIKDHEATGKLVVHYSRSPKDFPLNRYIQYREVTKDSGYYLRITAEEAARLVGGEVSEFVWPDGADRPMRNAGHEQFRFEDYKTQRFDFDFVLGYKSHKQADWDVLGTAAAAKAHQAMTARTKMVHKVLADETNWDANHVATVANILTNQGTWQLSTSQRKDIQRSLNYATNQIRQSTLTVVKKDDLILVMNPVTAYRVGESQEITDHVKHSEDAYRQVVQQEGKWSEYGLPNRLYGLEVIIEDTVVVTSARGATVAKSDAMADGIAYLLARPGGLVGAVNQGPAWSTCMCFLYEEMTVEHFDDDKHRRTDSHVVDDFAPVITSSISGFKFNSVIE